MPVSSNPEDTPDSQTVKRLDSLQESWQARWESSMTRQIHDLRQALQAEPPAALALRSGGRVEDQRICLDYWGSPVEVSWPELTLFYPQTGQPGSLFDTMLIIYYLRTANGAPLVDRWVSFRELPGGAFYHQAFQGYSGDRLARAFNSQPAAFHHASQALNGVHLTGLGEYAYAFQPLPRLRLAALFWPGDDEFESRGSVLFDASSLNYMVLDGLAILGSRLVSRLEKLKDSPKKP